MTKKIVKLTVEFEDDSKKTLTDVELAGLNAFFEAMDSLLKAVFKRL